jgi:dihydroorotate dehydrogenase electron transfer subunit
LNKIFRARIKENKKLSQNHYLITLCPQRKIARPKPGQFFMLSVDNGMDPLLKRPFSLHRRLGSDFQILYRTVGTATRMLGQKNKGDVLEMIGPLGNGFPAAGTKNKMILVAGGLGIAPLFSFAEIAARRNPMLFLGVKTRKEALCIPGLKSLGIKPVVTTDDGSLGKKGLITSEVNQFLTGHLSLITDYRIYACGPAPMLKELSSITNKFGLQAFMALEENMACGIGACLSCVVNTKTGYKRVCKEGPVFNAEEIVW